jgi:hypothetical protein
MDPRRLPSLATYAISAGSDSPALRELAALSEDEARRSPRSVIDTLVANAGRELGYPALTADEAAHSIAATREDAIAFAYRMSRRILTGEFQPPVELFKAASRVESVVTGFQWLDDDFPSAIRDFVFGWNVSGPESDAAIIATAQQLVEQIESDSGE